jgi:hypothetical protein
MGVEACTQAICDLALKFGEDRGGNAKEDVMVLENSKLSLAEQTFWCRFVNCWCG